MKVEIWSDVVCPWCYVGKRRFEAALSRFVHREHVEVVWRSFELDPSAARFRPGTYVERLADKYRMSGPEAQAMIDRMVEVGDQNGLLFNFDIVQPGNTFDAHRLLHLALDRGAQDELKERLFAATFTEGAPIGDRDVLVKLAVAGGLDFDEARAVLDGNAYSDEVRTDERRAAMLGITSVPFFVIDDHYGVTGAQQSDVLLRVLEDAWAEAQPIPTRPGTADISGCTDDTCTIVD